MPQAPRAARHLLVATTSDLHYQHRSRECYALLHASRHLPAQNIANSLATAWPHLQAAGTSSLADRRSRRLLARRGEGSTRRARYSCTATTRRATSTFMPTERTRYPPPIAYLPTPTSDRDYRRQV